MARGRVIPRPIVAQVSTATILKGTLAVLWVLQVVYLKPLDVIAPHSLFTGRANIYRANTRAR